METRFKKGQSGNPAGRPKGLARQVRELVGEDGKRIAQFFIEIMDDATEKTTDRLYAGRFLAERGWGKPAQFTLYEDEDPLGLSDDLDALVGKFDAEVRRLAPVAEADTAS